MTHKSRGPSCVLSKPKNFISIFNYIITICTNKYIDLYFNVHVIIDGAGRGKSQISDWRGRLHV